MSSQPKRVVLSQVYSKSRETNEPIVNRVIGRTIWRRDRRCVELRVWVAPLRSDGSVATHFERETGAGLYFSYDEIDGVIDFLRSVRDGEREAR